MNDRLMPGIRRRAGLLGFCLYCAASFCPEPSFAQDAVESVDLAQMSLEQLLNMDIESASKHSQSILWSPSAISVYTKEDIRASGADTLAEFLRRVPGLDVAFYKPLWHQVGARGLSSSANNRILLLCDGIEYIVEALGFPLWMAIPFDLIEIERIEVIRGPGSALYGANAFGAVINIVTIDDWKKGGDVVVSGGEQRFGRVMMRLRGIETLDEDRLSYSFAMGGEHYTGPTDPRTSHMTPLRGHGVIRYRTGPFDLSLHGSYAAADSGIDSVIGEMQMAHSKTHAEGAQVSVEPRDDLKLSLQLYHLRTAANLTTRSRVFALDLWVADIPYIPLDMNSYDAQLQMDWRPIDPLLLIGGATVRHFSLHSAGLVDNKFSEQRGAGFLHGEWLVWDWLQLTAGLRVDGNTETDTAVSPRGAVVVRPAESHAFRLSYGLAFRKPSFMERSMHLGFEDENVNPALDVLIGPGTAKNELRTAVGNSKIKNERVQSLELGYRGFLFEDRLGVSLDLFYNRYLGLILIKKVDDPAQLFTVASEREPVLYFDNDEDVFASVGGEAEARWRFASSWQVWANVALHGVYGEKLKERLTKTPILRSNLGGGRMPEHGLHFDLAVHCVSRYTDDEIVSPFDYTDKPEMELGNAWLLYAKLGYRFKLAPEGQYLDAALTLRQPLYPGSFREVAGFKVPEQYLLDIDSASDYGGEPLERLVAFYLRLTI